MTTEYSYSHMGEGKGHAYDAEFDGSAFLGYLWARERALLTRLIQQEGARLGKGLDYLDFACGTGRIISALEDSVSRAVGLDISPTMMEQARDRVTSAELILGNVFEDPELLTDTFDVVTSFRFFPNADPALRVRAAEFLRERVRPGGLFIMNNHQNARSVLCTAARAAGKKWPWTEADNREVVRLISDSGFRLEGKYGLGMLPGTARRAYAPLWMHALVDGTARGVGASEWAQNVIMWFRPQ